jgi:5-methylcytosine-specific restriction enzyme subunit McrC
MLAVVLALPSPFREDIAQYEQFDDVLEFVAAYFADKLEDLIRRGLYRYYVEAEDNLPYVRGRIDFVRDIRQNAVLREKTYCRYSELTWDIPENQILRQVTRLLSRWGFRKQVRVQLNQIDGTLDEVSLTALPARTIDGFHYHRLNESYRPLHQLCRLFLEGASISEDIGPFDFRTFLLDMNRLFEEFITQTLREKRPAEISVDSQDPMPFDEDNEVTIRPDIIVRRSRDILAVVDCKYKRADPGEFQNHDIYQMLAYCTVLGISEGLLVYPLHVSEARERIRVRNSRTTVRRVTIDLGGDLENLRNACDVLASEVFTAIPRDAV